jgi:hypothetical protein
LEFERIVKDASAAGVSDQLEDAVLAFAKEFFRRHSTNACDDERAAHFNPYLCVVQDAPP